MNYSTESNNKRQKKSRSKSKKRKNRVFTIIGRLIFVLFLVGFFAVGGAALGAYMGVMESTPSLDAMAIVPKNFTSFIYDANGNEIDRLHSEENRVYVKLDRIPKNLQNAYVAIEDERFYQHNGIDMRGIMRAIVANIKTASFSEGASTITQQLLKNNHNLLTSDKTFQRKIQEQYLAVKYESLLETNLGTKKAAKDYILELYMNSCGLDNNINGVQAAADYYFDKDVSQLTLAECASIAAITKHPTKFSPFKNPVDNKSRQELVLSYMLKQGYITQSEHDAAVAENISLALSNAQATYKEEKVSRHSYFTDAVIAALTKELMENPNGGMTEPQALNYIYSGGLKIYTTLDPAIQNIVDETYMNPELFPKDEKELQVTYALSVVNNSTKEQKHFEKVFTVTAEDQIPPIVEQYKAELIETPYVFLMDAYQAVPQPQSAAIVIDHHTGEVKALIGGRGDKQIARSFNRATQSKRQPGSTFKILAAYAPAIDMGVVSPATVIVDEPYTVPGYNYSPKNSNNSHLGPLTVREAVSRSTNIIAVKTLMMVSIETSFDYLLNFHITSLIDGSDRTDGKTDKGPAIALGGITDGVSPLELAAAYGTIANEGQYVKTSFYTRVLDNNGDTLIEHIPQPETVIKKQTAYILTDLMKGVIKGGTGSRANFSGMNIAGKTGTTNLNKDIWFAGYSPYYTCVTWLGYDRYDGGSKQQVRGSYHLALWKDIMSKIHADLPNKDFVRPDGIVSATVCKVSGKKAQEGVCTITITDMFLAGTVPSEVCNDHDALVKHVCAASGKLATTYCPIEGIMEEAVTNTAGLQFDEFNSIIWNPEDYCDVHTLENYDPFATPDHPVDYDDSEDDLFVDPPNGNDFNVNELGETTTQPLYVPETGQELIDGFIR